MCNTESLTTEIRKLINAYKSKIKLKEKFVYCFINSHYFLLSFTILFLLKGNSITFIVIDLLLYQL